MNTVFNKVKMHRRLSRYSKINISGLFSSKKNKNPLFFESYLECYIFHILEYDPNIKFIESQPLTIGYEANGRFLKYTPDSCVIDVHGKATYLETKPILKLVNATNSIKFKRIKKEFNRLGYEFKTLTELDLPSPQHMRNLEILHRNSFGINSDSCCVDFALEMLPTQVTLREAIDATLAVGLPKSVVSYLLFSQLYTCELNAPLNNDALLTRNIH